MKTSPTFAEKMAVAMELHETGVALMRQKMMRESGAPSAAAAQGDLRQWLLRKNDPIPGDVAGPVRIRFRRP